MRWWSEHPDGMELVRRLEFEDERRVKVEAGQMGLFEMEAPEPASSNGRDGEASAERRYTENGASNFAMKPGRRRS